MIVAVGSQNPSKLEAVRLGFCAYAPETEWTVVGTPASSGVGDQPMSPLETVRGAHARAKHALELAPEAAYGVGLEGGLERLDGEWYDRGWIVVRHRDGREGIGSTVGMPVDKEVIRLVLEEGQELGIAADRVFGTVNLKMAQGHFGFMTNNLITRATGYRDAVIVALSHLRHASVASQAPATAA